jgi:hypothetical protein
MPAGIISLIACPRLCTAGTAYQRFQRYDLADTGLLLLFGTRAQSLYVLIHCALSS